MLDTRPLLLDAGPAVDFPAIQRNALDILQVNLGYKCNLSCAHCHVNAGPSRTELMDWDTVECLLRFIKKQRIKVLDLTGGAPEMNPHFRYLVAEARALNVEVIDRCNLTILLEPGFEDLAAFLAQQQVTVTASLPCYLPDNVEKQRGKGVYQDSIEALQQLNGLGYGSDKNKQLNLVFNPVGAVLPPPQLALEQRYKQELYQRFGIVFNQLFTITNMPIMRFGSVLAAQGLFTEYMSLLKNHFNADNVKTVMCRNLISVDWQGYVYDCDFNQMLSMPLIASDRPRSHISELINYSFSDNPIEVGNHCFACTAGQGSSCGGALHD